VTALVALALVVLFELLALLVALRARARRQHPSAHSHGYQGTSFAAHGYAAPISIAKREAQAVVSESEALTPVLARGERFTARVRDLPTRAGDAHRVNRTAPARCVTTPRGAWARGERQVGSIPLSPARDPKGGSEFSPWLGTPPRQDVLVSEAPRVVLYDGAGAGAGARGGIPGSGAMRHPCYNERA
jgi:hypothetical protein